MWCRCHSTTGDCAPCARVTAGQYRPGRWACTGRRRCGAQVRTFAYRKPLRGAPEHQGALAGAESTPRTSSRNTSLEQGISDLSSLSTARRHWAEFLTARPDGAPLGVITRPPARGVLLPAAPRTSSPATAPMRLLPLRPAGLSASDRHPGGRASIAHSFRTQPHSPSGVARRRGYPGDIAGAHSWRTGRSLRCSETPAL